MATQSVTTRLGGILQRRREARKPPTSVPETTPVRVKGAVGEVVALNADATPFVELLDKARYEVREPRLGKHVHVSDLLSKCLRKMALVEKFDLRVITPGVSLTDSLTYAQGDAIHDVLRDRAARGGPRHLWGNWSCRCGATKTPTPCLLSEVTDAICSVCETDVSRYCEVPMPDNELMVVGTPDVIMYLPELDAFHVSELKSIAHDRWKELIQPVPDHILQALFYWFLMNRKGYKLTNRVSVIYATKGYVFKGSPVKEFTFDAAESLKRLESYLEDAKALKQFRAGAGPLPMRICASPDAPVARKCAACQVCFKGTDEGPKKVSISEALAGRKRK